MRKYILFGLVFLVCISYASAIESPDFAYKLDTNTANQPDSTGNYGTATVNGATYDSSVFKDIASYNYVADTDNITSAVKFNATTAFTLIMWFNWSIDTQRIYSFWSQSDDGGTDTLYIWYDARAGQNKWAVYVPTAGGACNIATASAPVDNAWQYLELRYNGTGLRLMVNDTIIGEDSTACSGIVNVTGYGGNGIIGGSMVAGLVTSFEGNIDEVYGWIDYAFTDSDHAEMYNSGAGTFFPWDVFRINSVTNAYNLSTIQNYAARFYKSAPQSILDSVVASYPLNGYTYDTVGGYDGDAVGAVPNADNTGYVFDGVDDYISTTNYLFSDFDYSYFWVYLIINQSCYQPGTYRRFASQQRSSTNLTWVIYSAGTNNSVGFNMRTGGDACSGNADNNVLMDCGVEQRIIAIYNGSHNILYINGTGVSVKSVGAELCKSKWPLTLGKDNVPGISTWNGTIFYFAAGSGLPLGYTTSDLVNYLNNSGSEIFNRYINTVNGTIPFVYNETLNISIYNISGSEGQYFNKSFENYLTTSFLNTYAWQSFLVYTAQEKITNRTLGSFNITIGSQFNTSNSSNETTFLLNAGTYNVTGMAQGYLWNATDTQTLTNLQSASDVLYFAPDRLNITARDYLTNATITNFTIQFNYNDSYYENISTTTGLVQFYGVNGSYEITIYASGSYDPAAVNFTLNDTDMAYQFSLFQNNKIRLNFLEEETLLPAINITYEVYGDYFSYKGFQNTNFTDVDSLPDGIYEIRYAINSTPWMQRSYYLKIPASSSSEVNLSLLLVNTSQGYQFIRSIKDQDSLPYDGYLQIQRAYVSADNSTYIYRTVEIASIDSQGNAVFSAIPNVQPYRFRILDTELNVVNTKNSAYLVDTSSDITVQTSTSLMQGYYIASGIMMYANASYNNLTSYYILDYSDSSSSITRCCVAYKFTSAGNTSSNSACSTDYSGTIAVYIPVQNGTYLAESFCTIYGEDIPIDSELISWSPFLDNTNLFRLVGGILYILIIILCATIARFVNPLISLFTALGATAIFSLSVLGLIYIVPYLLGGLLVVTVIVAWLVFR